jgi:hypothetical protein
MEVDKYYFLEFILNAYSARELGIDFDFTVDDESEHTGRFNINVRFNRYHPSNEVLNILKRAWFDNERKKAIQNINRLERVKDAEEQKKALLRHVYVMLNKVTGKYKIGRSNNPEYREKTLQSQEPDIELLFSCHESIVSEKKLHEIFNDKRVRGEWFDLDSDDILEIRKIMQL